jgi:hypothetical protein
MSGDQPAAYSGSWQRMNQMAEGSTFAEMRSGWLKKLLFVH